MNIAPHMLPMWFFPKLANWQIVQDILRIIDPEYVSPLARREHTQKSAGNPQEHRAARDRLAREDSLYRHGFPVAGHGEADQPRIRPRQRP